MTYASELMVVGRNFTIPATQQIEFVPLKKIEASKFKKFPQAINLRSNQSAVKSQGKRGACTYFVMAALVESLLKKQTKKEIDVSEEYIAWAGKVKKALRSTEEDSSVAVNAATVQDFGFMLEEDLPYEQSWFDPGLPCAGKRGTLNIDPICFSHKGPDAEKAKRINTNYQFIFEAVDSSSLDVVKTMSRFKNPVTVSILGHSKMWGDSGKTGELILTEAMKEECQNNRKLCSSHAALIVGYDLTKKLFIIKNSWGEDWGDKGFGTISFDYIDQMSPRKFMTGYVK